MKFQKLNFSINDIIFYASFDDTFQNPIDDDAFQTSKYILNCLRSKLGLKSDQMDPNSFGQPWSQLMGNFDDAS